MKLSDYPQELRDHPMIKFKEELVGGQEVVIVSYMVADSDLWKIPLSKETRGNTFDKETGRCISRSFPKFFNLGETEETLIHNLPWNEDYEVTTKLDGSLITGIRLETGEIEFKSKKSFFSEVALLAKASATSRVKALSTYCLMRNQTPIFEFTCPENRVVISYGDKPKFTLLAIRDNESGKFLPRKRVENISDLYGVDLVELHLMRTLGREIQNLLDDMKEQKNFEGYVIHFLESDLFVKVKTPWYLLEHMVRTDLRFRDVAKLVIEEMIDDMKSRVSLAGLNLSPIEKIESQVVSELLSIEKTIEEKVLENKGKTFKEAAESLKGFKYFSQVMSVLREKNVDIKDIWKKEFLKNYSLVCVYNEKFTR
jgi:T4 RnlA family RNA ligase